ncbi:MAG: DNA-binding response regulator [Kangiella sp.]|nr:MAG: DNA-binding response regulator [Kangiella sp.]
MNIRVLLIEDNQAIAEQLCDYLEQDNFQVNFQVDYACDGRTGFNLVQDNQYEVILLDLMLPDIDGVELCKKIKATSDIATPILMLTARDSLFDKSKGFDAGADDYLTKPFELQEVAMRCVALARRQQLHQSSKINIGELVVDVKKHLVKRNEKNINLSAKNFTILLLLAKAYPNALSRHEITAKVWGEDFPDSDVLRSHIYTIRNVIDKPFDFPMIKTIHGVGFKLEEKS